MSKYISFETDRLILKPTDETDDSFILELLNTPKWIKNIGNRDVHTLEDAQNYIKQRITGDFEKKGYGNYLVIRKSDGAKLGSCGLYDRKGLEGIDIGFAFLPQHERKGYAFESALRIRDAAFQEFDIPKLCAITTKENVASQRLLEKLGLNFIKIVNLPDDDLMYYELYAKKTD